MSIIQSTRRPPIYKPMLGDILSSGHPLAKDMLACYLMNEGAGKTYNSLVNNAQHQMTPQNSAVPVWGPTIWGVGVSGGTSGAMATLAHSLLDNLPNSALGVTWLLWIKKPGTTSPWHKTTEFNDNSPGWFMTISGGNIRMACYGSSGNMLITSSGATINSTDPFQCVCVYNGAGALTAANYQWYINTKSGTQSAQNGGGSYSSDSGNRMFFVSNCGIDHAILWNRPLSQGEIIQLYQDPFCFMAPNQRSRVYQVGGLSPQRRTRYHVQVY